jgi:hypothetical protein
LKPYTRPIIINEITYAVENKDVVLLGTELCKGTSNQNTAVIEMSTVIAQSIYNHTLMHEIVHCINEAYHLDFGEDDERITD